MLQTLIGEQTQAKGQDFYIHPSAYDHAGDGPGHTWKRYYLFWDSGQLREYGGLQISQEELVGLKGLALFVSAAFVRTITNCHHGVFFSSG